MTIDEYITLRINAIVDEKLKSLQRFEINELDSLMESDSNMLGQIYQLGFRLARVEALTEKMRALMPSTDERLTPEGRTIQTMPATVGGCFGPKFNVGGRELHMFAGAPGQECEFLTGPGTRCGKLATNSIHGHDGKSDQPLPDELIRPEDPAASIPRGVTFSDARGAGFDFEDSEKNLQQIERECPGNLNRPAKCFWCDGTRPKRDGLCEIHASLFFTNSEIWQDVQAEIAEDQNAARDSGGNLVDKDHFPVD